VLRTASARLNPGQLASITGGQNILDARYLVVNRLAPKCIQRLGLKSIDRSLGVWRVKNYLRQRQFFTVGV
jgi:hypothetical protein